jgi:hypothetical protein
MRWQKVVKRKAAAEQPLVGPLAATPKAARGSPSSSTTLGAVPRLEDEPVHPTQVRGSKVDGRRLPRTGRLYQTNIRANERIVREFDADAEKLGLTRGALFEKCYHAFKAQQGDKGTAFLLQAMVKLDHISKAESKARGRVVTPEAVLEDMFAQRAEMLGMRRDR